MSGLLFIISDQERINWFLDVIASLVITMSVTHWFTDPLTFQNISYACHANNADKRSADYPGNVAHEGLDGHVDDEGHEGHVSYIKVIYVVKVMRYTKVTYAMQIIPLKSLKQFIQVNASQVGPEV